MKIIEKLAAKQKDIKESPCPTIAFLGDSVTQGCFELYLTGENSFDTVFDAEHGYHAYLKRILGMLYPKAPVHILNAGISGDNAERTLARLERDVLRHKPDLTVVCLGLNDCVVGGKVAEDYPENMRQIFQALLENGSEVIFMTPNCMASYVSFRMENICYRELAAKVSAIQNSGKLKAMLESSKAIAQDMHIPVCDVYAKWETLAASGVDTTALLSNLINHPTREMNWLFACSLAETMFGGTHHV